MPDECKIPMHYYSIAEDPILSTTDSTRSPHSGSPPELTNVVRDKPTINNLPTCNVDQLLKSSRILLVRIFQ